MEDERITVTEAARRIGVTPAAIRHAIRDGRLPAELTHPPGAPARGVWIVKWSDVQAYADNRWQDRPWLSEWWKKRQDQE